MTYNKSNDRVSSELFSDREGESPAVSSPRFRQETNFPRELRFENKVETTSLHVTQSECLLFK